MKIQVIESPVYHIIIDDCFEIDVANKILNELKILQPFYVDAEIRTNGVQEKNKNIRSNKVCYIDKLYNSDLLKTWTMRKIYRANKSILLKSIDNLIEGFMLKQLTFSANFPICKLSEVDTWETQISWYGNSDKYEWHADRNVGDSRVITMVYYVHSNPKKYTGGQLILSSGLRNGDEIINDNRVIIEPKHNRLVIFDSRKLHRVMTTSSPDRFEDGRFSVNIFAGIGSGSIY